MVRLVLPAVLLAAGCGQQLVYVSDETGLPVEGADVTVVYPSSNGAPSRTNAAGIAPVSGGVLFKPAWVRVSAAGFVPLEADWPVRWPLELMLRR